jgi:D-alanyl-D-alanine carboxypeptidase (penicillin-binding protein 5/6)
MKPFQQLILGILLLASGLTPVSAAPKAKPTAAGEAPVAANPDVGPGGVPMLIRPGMKVEPPKPAPIAPDDPLAKEKQRLRDWEQGLNLTADSLAGRIKALSEREQLLRELEDSVKLREESVQSREAAVSARESLLRSRETAPDVKPFAGGSAPKVVGKHAIVIDAEDGRILHEKDARSSAPVASTQKLMTALLVVEAGELDRMVVIDAADTDVEPSVLGFRAGESYRRSDLVKWLLVRSGNDVAKALARDNAGSEAAFAAKMNAKAVELGMTNSHFVNPHGLTVPKQHSCARDMALLAWACYQKPFIRECVALKTFSLKLNHGTVREAVNTNRVLREFAPCTGMKTGFTDAAGSCLVTSAEKDGRTRICIVLGSTGSWCAKDSEALLEWSLASD